MAIHLNVMLDTETIATITDPGIVRASLRALADRATEGEEPPDYDDEFATLLLLEREERRRADAASPYKPSQNCHGADVRAQ